VGRKNSKRKIDFREIQATQCYKETAMIVASVLTGNRPNTRIARVSPASHQIAVQRQSEGQWVAIPTGYEVEPDEAIRVRVSGTGFSIEPWNTAKNQISFMHGITGNMWREKTIKSSQRGNASWDTFAPRLPGPYTVTATTEHGFGWSKSSHSSQVALNVSGDAPDAPRPTTDGGFWDGRIGQFISTPFRAAGKAAKSAMTTLLLTALVVGGIVVIGLVVVAKVMP